MISSHGNIKNIFNFLVFFVIFFLKLFSENFDDVKSGTKFSFLSVIEGEKIESFELEFLKVVRGQEYVKELLLVKPTNETIKRAGGISEGMSGSPVYLGNKLIGALSYVVEDTNLALVTPIADILKLTKFDETIPLPPNLTIQKAKPGMAISITPVRGDISMDSLATLTHVDQNKVYSLGHSFEDKGSVRYFLNRATIDYNVKSKSIPFKIGRSLETIGLITQDRKAGISGYLTNDIKTCKINMEISTKVENKVCKYEIVLDDSTIINYMSSSINIALLNNLDSESYKSVKYSYELLDENNNVILRREDIENFENSIVTNISEIIGNEIVSLVGANSKKLKLKTINMKFEFSENKNLVYIDNFTLKNNILKISDVMEIIFDCSVYKKGNVKKKVEINMSNFKIGFYRLNIYPGSYFKKEPDFYDYDTLINFYKNQFKNSNVIIRITKQDEKNDSVYFDYKFDMSGYVLIKKPLELEIIVDSLEAVGN